jgi:hypothetical protein
MYFAAKTVISTLALQTTSRIGWQRTKRELAVNSSGPKGPLNCSRQYIVKTKVKPEDLNAA